MQEHFSLQTYNSFGFNTNARYFTEIHSVEELESFTRTDVFKHNRHLILGGGNNVLFCDDLFNGAVIHMNTKGIEFISDTVVRAQAGEDWPNFVRFIVGRGLYGLENLAHIPGTVGAAPVQNIGAYGMELKDSFLQCEALNLATGKKRIFTKDECHFGYRSSIFKHELKGLYAILSVDFQLKKQAELNLDYGNIQSHLAQRGITRPTLQQLHDAICEIRESKLPNVKELGNAGSFFKNPVIEMTHFEVLLKEHPDMPHYPETVSEVKIPAGWLIEKAGWKGWRNEHVGVYEKQALILIHYGGGTGNDIVALSKRIQQSVKEKFGIAIEAEVNFA